jgi:hypothetical protein
MPIRPSFSPAIGNMCAMTKQETLPATAHVFCLFRPQKSMAFGTSERALQRLLCMFTRPGQQFSDVRVSHVGLKMR